MGGAATDRWGVPVHAGGDRGVALLDDAVEGLVALAGTPAAHSAAAADADGDLALAVIVGAYLALYGASPEGVATAPSAPRAPRRLAAPARGVPPPGGPGLGRRRARTGARRPRAGPGPPPPRPPRPQDRPRTCTSPPARARPSARRRRAGAGGLAGRPSRLGLRAGDVRLRARRERAVPRGRGAGPGGTGPQPRATSGPSTPWPTSSRWRAGRKAGVDFLRSSAPDWRSSFFAVHNWWHRALCHLELGQIGEVLALYDGPIRGARSNLWLDVDDAASLLWRLSLYGIGLGERAHALASAVDPLVSEPVAVFNDWHAVMALGLAGHHQRNPEILAANRERSVGTNRAAGEQAGFALLEGFGAFAAGRLRPGHRAPGRPGARRPGGRGEPRPARRAQPHRDRRCGPGRRHSAGRRPGGRSGGGQAGGGRGNPTPARGQRRAG